VTPEPSSGSHGRAEMPVDEYEARTVSPARPVLAPYDPRAERIVWLITAVIDVILAMRFIFMLLGASPQAAFTALLYGVTLPLVAPFLGMWPAAGHGGSVFDPASLTGIVVYTLIGWVIVAAIRIRHSRRQPSP
jgi:hypothetical protein